MNNKKSVGHAYVINVYNNGWKNPHQVIRIYMKNKKGFGFRITKIK